MNIKDIVKNNRVYFQKYRQGIMYYTVPYEGNMYQFTVPLEDVQDATLFASDKAITFMRYIRKALDSGELVKYV